MAKRYPGAERHVFTSDTYTYDGKRHDIGGGRVLPNSIFVYWADFCCVQEAFYDASLKNRAVKPRLIAALQAPDIRSALTDIVTSLTCDSGGSLFADARRLHQSIRPLSDEDLQNIAEYVVEKRYSFPGSVNYWTFPEAYVTGLAIAQTPRNARARWQQVEGESALRFSGEGGGLEVKFVPGPRLNPHGIDAAYQILNRHDQRTVLCFQLVLDAILQVASGPARIQLDEIISILGLSPRNVEERREARRTIWTWLRTFESMVVIGRRPGKWGVRNLYIEEALIKVQAFTGIPEEYGGPMECPWEVEMSAGDWLDGHRSNRQVLTYLGNLMPLARIPGGKAGGAWAQSIGMALLQKWRVGATKAPAKRVGETASGDKREAFGLETTRRELLSMFPPDPSFKELRPHPKRAMDYWEAAIAMLEADESGLISTIIENFPLRPTFRYDDWLNQPLEIRAAKGVRDQVIAVKAGKPRLRSRKRAVTDK